MNRTHFEHQPVVFPSSIKYMSCSAVKQSSSTPNSQCFRLCLKFFQKRLLRLFLKRYMSCLPCLHQKDIKFIKNWKQEKWVSFFILIWNVFHRWSTVFCGITECKKNKTDPKSLRMMVVLRRFQNTCCFLVFYSENFYQWCGVLE